MSSKIQLPTPGLLPSVTISSSLLSATLLSQTIDNVPEVLYLFTKSDFKTILIPVVRLVHALAHFVSAC